MRILLTNDDGIYAPGLLTLFGELRQDHDLFVVAPETEQSAVGHSITIADPIRVKPARKNGETLGFALGGTPADCVRIGASELMESPPELVVSGINRGGNVGINVLYSGTISAANEAAIMGLPAIAVSLNAYKNPDFEFAAKFTRKLIAHFKELDIPAGVSLSVNVPDLPSDKIKQPVWTRQCINASGEFFSRREDPRGNTYYWRGTEIPPAQYDQDTDYALLHQGHITLTPLKHDLTHHEELERLKNLHIVL